MRVCVHVSTVSHAHIPLSLRFLHRTLISPKKPQCFHLLSSPINSIRRDNWLVAAKRSQRRCFLFLRKSKRNNPKHRVLYKHRLLYIERKFLSIYNGLGWVLMYICASAHVLCEPTHIHDHVMVG